MKRSGQTVLWELWAALCLCTALVLPPGSPWLHEPALLYPGLSLAAVVPAAWAVWRVGVGVPSWGRAMSSMPSAPAASARKLMPVNTAGVS